MTLGVQGAMVPDKMRDTDTISVASLATGNLDHDDGRRVYDAIQTALAAGRNVRIDFSGIDIVTPSLLNTSFRVLAEQHDKEFLKSRLQIVNSNRLINDMVRDALTPKDIEQARRLRADLDRRQPKTSIDRDRDREK